MRLQLRFFAAIREAVGSAEAAIEVDVLPPSLAALFDLIDPSRSMQVVRDPRVRIAVNGRILGAEEPLQLAPGDEVALLPPVTGG